MASFISRRRRINWVRFSLPPAERLRPLAHVLRFAVDVQDQRLQLGLEADVIVRAAQPALAAELVEGDAADRAGLLVQLGQLLGRLADRPSAGPCCASTAAMLPAGRRLARRTRSGTAARGPRTGAVPAACRRSVR